MRDRCEEPLEGGDRGLAGPARDPHDHSLARGACWHRLDGEGDAPRGGVSAIKGDGERRALQTATKT